jgi:hypothetical protein
MSSHGRGGQDGRRSARGEPPGVVWSLVVIATALIGGLAAAALVHTSLIIAAIVSIAAAIIAVFVVVRWPGQPEELTDGRSQGLERGPQRPQPDDGSAPTRPYPLAQPLEPSPGAGYTRVDPRYARPEPRYAEPETLTRTESAVDLIPFPARADTSNSQPPGAQNWWQQPVAASPPPSREGRRAPAPDLSTYLDSTVTGHLDSTVIAQCPRCGAFKLDIDRDRDPWAFRCQACDDTWTWRTGTPWPPVRVAPRRRRDSRPLSP